MRRSRAAAAAAATGRLRSYRRHADVTVLLSRRTHARTHTHMGSGVAAFSRVLICGLAAAAAAAAAA